MYLLSKVIFIRKLGGLGKLGDWIELGVYWINLGYVMGKIACEKSGDRALDGKIFLE
jgi:hypothetical protein